MQILKITAVLAAGCWITLSAPTADAGCGCDKPPPPLASVRPAFASPGDQVTLFAPELVAGAKYKVRFGNAAPIVAQAVVRRDYADGVTKPQLVVAAPPLPPGPTKIKVNEKGRTDEDDGDDGNLVVKVPEEAFTMLQPAIALPEADTHLVVSCYQAAVGSDGTVYFPFDIGAIAKRTVFSGLGRSYPLLFAADDVMIYNRQGVLMQLLGPEVADIFDIEDTSGAPDSLELVYDRHEFETYRAAHAHENGLGLDPADPAWHADGSRHIDHDHLVLAIRGVVEKQGKAKAGVTPAFDLDLVTAVEGASSGALASSQIAWSAGCRKKKS